MPFYLRVAGKKRSGEYINASLKAWPVEDSTNLFWDAVRVTSIVGVNVQGGTVFKTWWKRWKPKLCAMWSVLGYEESACFLPSLRAARARRLEVHDNSKEVVVWSTQALIAGLLHMSTSAWLDRDKDTWTALFDGCLALKQVALGELIALAVSEEPWTCCASWNVER
eukprot:3852536-Amphidinium_carterae.1